MRLSRGVDGIFEQAFLAFAIKDKSYPIWVYPENVSGVTYRSQPKAYVDREVFRVCFRDIKTTKPLSNGRTHTSGQNFDYDGELKDLPRKVKTDISCLPEKCRDLLQLRDSFVIKKVKDMWRYFWDDYLMEAVKKEVSIRSDKMEARASISF